MTQSLANAIHFVPDEALAEELLANYGSPLYVYDAAHLDQRILEVANSIKYSRTRFAFAAVTNGNIALLRRFKTAGWGLHANTPGDAFLGLKAGFDSADIIYSGSNLTEFDMCQLLEWRIGTFNFDSIAQLEMLCRIRSNSDAPLRIGFRLNLPSVTGASRIGISPGELVEADRFAAAHGIAVTGIHFYRGTSTNATERFFDCIEPVLDAGALLRDWQYLDFGGGFGFPYFDRRHSFEWNEFGNALTNALKLRGKELDLIIEPGRSVIAGCAVLLCTVVSSKWQDQKQIVGVDTTTSNIAVLSVHGGTRQVRCYNRQGETEFLTDVCGNTTYSRDYVSRSCTLPELREGDVLAVLDAGAYGYAMSSHFLHRPRPPEVLIENGSHRLIRQRETMDCLLANQVDAP